MRPHVFSGSPREHLVNDSRQISNSFRDAFTPPPPLSIVFKIFHAAFKHTHHETLFSILMTSTKGRNFSPAEDYALATAWVSNSETTGNLRSDLFWNAVHSRYKQLNSSLETCRTPGSLETRWRTLSRVAQKYIAADRLYRSSKAHSGECEEDALRNIMTLYCSTNKYKDKGTLRTPGPIKSMEAVMYLSKIPKFSMKVGAESSKSSAPLQVEDKKDVPHGQGVIRANEIQGVKTGNISMHAPASARPAGWKRRKNEEKIENGTHRVARSVAKMATALATAAADKRKVVALGLQLEIFKSTPMADREKRRMLELLQRDAANLFRAEEPENYAHDDLDVEKIPPSQDGAQTSPTNADSSSLRSAPSFVIMGPNSSSFQQFQDDEEAVPSQSDAGSGFTK